MKKILAFVTVLILGISLAACAEIRNTEPVLVGVQPTVSIMKGDAFDPLAGITATDAEDGDLTESIIVEGYNAAWVEQQGNHSYILTVTDSQGLIAQATITLIVLSNTSNQAPVLAGVFNNQSFYIGSSTYDPLRGITATDAEDGDLTASIELTGEYSQTRAGKYTLTISVKDSDDAVASEIIILTVKADVNIPDTLTSDPISITLWHSNGTTIEDAIKSYALSFTQLYPNITVNIVKNGSNYDELRETFIKTIRGGTLPNIIQNYPDHVMEYIDNSAVTSLTPYIDDANWGYGTGSDSFMDILEVYRRENSQYTPDGEYYSIPFNKSTEVVIYNKTLFDDMIADGVITEFPSTWQDLMALQPAINERKDALIDQICANLNLATNSSLHKTAEEIQAIKNNFYPFSYDSSANAFITLTRQWGGSYTTIDTSRKGVLLFDNDQTASMLNYFFTNRTIFTIPQIWTSDYASDLFKVGQTVVTVGSTGGARYNTPAQITYTDGTGTHTIPAFEIGIAPMLYNKDMPENNTAIQQGTNMSITTAGTAQQKLASWLFLKYLTSQAVQLDFALKTGYSPVRTSVYGTAQYLQYTQGLNAQGNPLTGEALTISLAANAAALQKDTLFYDQAYIGSSTTRSAVEVAFQRVMLAESGANATETIDAAIAYAIAESERVLGN